MKALEQSDRFFREQVLPQLQTDYPLLLPKLAAGLVGNGSECFGYDDELSRDHDWGVDFFIWVPDEEASAVPELQRWKADICRRIPEQLRKAESAYGARVGVQTVSEFYQSLIGCPDRPSNLSQWLAAPEDNLAMTVNGSVFLDNDGRFSSVRERILSYFPEDIRLKKISAACMRAAQAGQYNFPRMSRREDWVTVEELLTRFRAYCVHLVFLFNKVYRPYYKWAFRAMTELPILGKEMGCQLKELTLISGYDAAALARRQEKIEEICIMLASELNRQGLSLETDPFLLVHGESVRLRIGNERLRSLPAQVDPFQ